MCQAFSCLVTCKGKVYWKLGLDSHDLIRDFYNQDSDLSDDEENPTFARVEVAPNNDNYLKPDKWEFMLNQDEPQWWKNGYVKTCEKKREEWYKQITEQINMKEALNPIHPFKIKPPTEITEQQLKLLREWTSVGDSVWVSVKDSVSDSFGDSVENSVGDSVWVSVGDSVWVSVWDSFGTSVRASVGDSVRASIYAYFGSLFPKISEWKYVDVTKPPFDRIKGYPFQSGVELWKMGLVPSYDGAEWRLHGGLKASVLWEGTLSEVK